jgi:hypothetical protein
LVTLPEEEYIDLKRSLKKFASQPSHIQSQFIEDLRRFSPNIEDEIEYNIAPLELSDGSQDYPAKVNKNLYSVLQRHAQCECPMRDIQPNLRKRHQARLQLVWNLSTERSNITFNMLFSKLPVSAIGDGDGLQWQKLQFHVPR